jgi:uncharacterized protein
MSNVATLQAMYQAFGRGDIPAILEHFADDIVWEVGDDSGGHGVPWLLPRRGRQAVVGFFEALAPLEFTRFEPKEFLTSADGKTVVALLDIEANVRGGPTLREIDEVHIWRFDDRGRVASFRHRVDTARQVEAAASAGLVKIS